MLDPIYLDHAAMSPVLPQAAAAMQPWLSARFGNPSALYRAGREAAAAVEAARRTVAGALNCRADEIIFTSGGTESINAALKGIGFAHRLARLGSHLVVTGIEHDAVRHSTLYLEKFGFQTTVVDPAGDGLIDPEAVAAAVQPDTALVSVMLANNEVGTVQPLAAIVAAVRGRARSWDRPIPIHTDAVQAPLWLPVDVQALGVDALSLSAYKFGGPTGAGVLYLRRGVAFLAQQSGGGQERQRRAGTEHVAGIIGLGAALTAAEHGRAARSACVARLSSRLIAGIRRTLPEATLNGDEQARLPNIVNFSFPNTEGERLVLELDRRNVAVSSGAACGATSWEPSHVLLAMGLQLERAAGAIRFSLGPETTAAEIDATIERLPAAVHVAAAAAVGST